MIGGGVATVAGGVKLLRIYALYRLGLREMDRLIHPSGVGRRGRGDTLISHRGARIAFIFLMLFLVALALTMAALAASGLSFNHSLALAVGALTTCGQAIHVLGGGASYATMPEPALAVLGGAMIVGRMEARRRRALQPDELAVVSAARVIPARHPRAASSAASAP